MLQPLRSYTFGQNNFGPKKVTFSGHLLVSPKNAKLLYGMGM